MTCPRAPTGLRLLSAIEASDSDATLDVLDIGCGPGDFTRAFSETGAIVTGVDFSPEMIRVAQDRFPRVTFKVADAESLPFGDCSFDVVVGAYVVHHLARPDLAFREIYRVLRPGGRFVFVIPIQEAQASFDFCPQPSTPTWGRSGSWADSSRPISATPEIATATTSPA